MKLAFRSAFVMIVPVVLVIMVFASSRASAITVDRVLATVDDEVITLSDYKLFLRTTGRTGNPERVDEVLLKGLIEERVVLHEALKRGMDLSDTELDSMVEEFRRESPVALSELEKGGSKENGTTAAYRQFVKGKVLSSKLIHDEVDSRIVITDREVEDYYQANRTKFVARPAQVKIKVIFLKLSEDATVTEVTDLKRKSLRIAAQAKDGVSFEVLRYQYSAESLKGQDGESLGEFEKGTLLSPLDEKVFSMKKGEISDPVWLKDGVYIIKLVDRTDEQYKPLVEIREQINKDLSAKKREGMLNEWMRKLWEKASVTIKE